MEYNFKKIEKKWQDIWYRQNTFALKEEGVTRISINPQTMKDDTLKIIGRRHTAKQTEEQFYLARSLG